MTGRLLAVALALMLGAGCIWTDKKADDVSSSLFRQTGRSAKLPEVTPATRELSLRVQTLGQKIVTANPNLMVGVEFITIGSPQPEIFHVMGPRHWYVYVTEGLVKQCQGDGQLAAVLCQELGKASSERIAEASARRQAAELPPLVNVGNDLTGRFGSADGSQMAEMGRLDQARRQTAQPPPAPPAPDGLARGYLAKAGFAVTDLDAVAGLLRAADRNSTFEKQMKGATP
jgi:predicted Zn-dependent protease